MPPLENPKHEQVAMALADGRSPRQAYKDAGFTSLGRAEAFARRPEIVARVAELKQPGKRPPTVAMLTEQLTRIAAAAEAQGNATGLSVARGACMDLARLNGLWGRRDGAAPGEEARPLDHDPAPPMTEAEWFETYAPKDP